MLRTTSLEAAPQELLYLLTRGDGVDRGKRAGGTRAAQQLPGDLTVAAALRAVLVTPDLRKPVYTDLHHGADWTGEGASLGDANADVQAEDRVAMGAAEQALTAFGFRTALDLRLPMTMARLSL